MLSYIALVLGLIGTVWLALDVAEPRILRKINVYFKIIARLKFDFRMIWKKELNDYDFKVISILKTMSLWVSIFVLLIFAPELVQLNSEHIVVEIVTYFMLAFCITAFLSLNTIESAPRFSLFLLSLAEKVITPLLIAYFYIFSAVGIVIKHVSRVTLASEGRYLGKYQSPRFLGLVLLFLSFLLQLWGLES
ncbi:hypothetical protein [Vibrio parahaemolyticus]|uniref:hypothetical protein n=1 Tax=Vibrio parahaemolyticus TaxID=670 RepID=UPI0022EB9BDB|nr:hypothetical protein [Vibrio parahaemolyticus]